MPKAVSRQSKNKQKASKIAKAKASAGMNQKLAEDKTFGALLLLGPELDSGARSGGALTPRWCGCGQA